MPALLSKIESFYKARGMPLGPEVEELVRNSEALGLSDDEVMRNLEARHKARQDSPPAADDDAHLVTGGKVYLKRSNGKWTPARITSMDDKGYVVEWQEADESWLHKVVSYKNKAHLKPRGDRARKETPAAAAPAQQDQAAADLAEAQRIAMEAAAAQDAAIEAARAAAAQEVEKRKAEEAEKAAAEKAAAEKAAAETAAAEKAAAEKTAAEAADKAAEKAAAEAAEQAAAEKAAADKATAEKAAADKAAAEKAAADKAAAEKAAAEKAAAEKAAAEKAAAEAEDKAAAEKAAAEETRKEECRAAEAAAQEAKRLAVAAAAKQEAEEAARLREVERREAVVAAEAQRVDDLQAAAQSALLKKGGSWKKEKDVPTADEKEMERQRVLEEREENSAFNRPRQRVHFNPNTGTSPTRTPVSPLRSKAAPVAPVSPVQFREALQSPRFGPESARKKNTTDLLLVDGRGTSLLDDVTEFLDDEKVQFILTQIPLGSGTFKRNKWLFLTYVGEKCKMMTKAKHVQKSGEVSHLFGSTHASLTITQRDQVNLEYVLDELKHVFVADDGTFSIQALREEISQNVAAAQKEQEEAIEEAVRQTMSALPTVRPTAAGIGLEAEDVMRELRKPMGAFNWALFKADPRDMHLIDAGSDSLVEMAEYVDESAVQYALVRLGFGMGAFRRTKWVVITFVGSEVSGVKRGQLLSLKGRMENLLAPFQVSLEVQGREDLEVEKIIDRVRPYIVADDIKSSGKKGAKEMKVTLADFNQALAEEKIVTAEFFGEDPAQSVASLAAFAPIEKDFEQGETIEHVKDAANPLLWGVFSINPDFNK